MVQYFGLSSRRCVLPGKEEKGQSRMNDKGTQREIKNWLELLCLFGYNVFQVGE